MNTVLVVTEHDRDDDATEVIGVFRTPESAFEKVVNHFNDRRNWQELEEILDITELTLSQCGVITLVTDKASPDVEVAITAMEVQ